MKKLLLLFMLSLLFSEVFCQKRHGFGFIPSRAEQINGIAIGPMESIILDNPHSGKELNQTINGLTLNLIGLGMFVLPGLGEDPHGEIFDKKRKSTLPKELAFWDSLATFERPIVSHNGIVLATTGMITGKVNGIIAGGLAGGASKFSGISILPLLHINTSGSGLSCSAYNLSYKFRGLQLGLFNRAARLKGIQIGLWNVNLKRRLPIINWDF